jgi:chemotaxis receptor (MCP) glutamine deamidase CheD
MNSKTNLRADNARYVGIGEILTGKHPCVFSTVVSSCVAMMIYDSTSRWGGMVHILISGKGRCHSEEGRFSDSAVSQLVSEAKDNTSPDSSIAAKIVGGAGSSSIVDSGSLLKNISSTTLIRVMELVLNEGIEVVGMHGGGEGSRKIFFDLKDGRVEVYHKGKLVII